MMPGSTLTDGLDAFLTLVRGLTGADGGAVYLRDGDLLTSAAAQNGAESRARSIFVAPLCDGEGTVHGVIELTNPRDNEGEVARFEATAKARVEALLDVIGDALSHRTPTRWTSVGACTAPR